VPVAPSIKTRFFGEVVSVITNDYAANGSRSERQKHAKDRSQGLYGTLNPLSSSMTRLERLFFPWAMTVRLEASFMKLATLVAGILAACMASAAWSQDAEPAPEPAPRLVKLINASEMDGAVTRRFFGRVVAKETVDLAFQVGGQIVEFPVIEGQPIPKDSLIAQLDLEPFELALEQAKLEQDQADRTLERLKKLEGNTVSQVTVDDAETASNLAAVNVKNAERSLRNATLEAPFDALVAVRNVANFSTIAAGTAVTRIHDMSELRVEIDVPEILFQQAGENPDVTLMAKFPASEELFPLETREFNAQTSDVGQSFKITLGMAPPENMVILPGSSVEVVATLNQGDAFVEIPYTAVVFDEGGGTNVMVFEPAGADEGTIKTVPIETEPTNEGGLRVTSGLEAGAEIVASGGALLEDGQAVRRFTGFPN
jgi:RND family efflux transporter MFP subunit